MTSSSPDGTSSGFEPAATTIRVPGAAGAGVDPDARKERALLVRAEARPGEPVDTGGPEGDVPLRRFRGRRVDRARRDLAAGPLRDEAGRPVRPETRETPFLALLEAEAGVGPQRVTEGRPPDADRVEDGGLDDDLGRVVADLGAGTAHDAGDADRAARVGDEQRLGLQLANDVVEGLESLAGFRAADDDPAIADERGVVCVDRFAELDHDVVRGIDDVADRPVSGSKEPHLDAVGRWCDPDVADPPTDELRAEVGVAHLDMEALGRRLARFGQIGRWHPDLAAGDGRQLARKADDRQRVTAIGLDIDVEHDVAIELGQRCPERRVLGQDQDPVGVAGQAELVTRAQHPVADDAHLLGPLDAPVAGQDRARQRDRDALAGGDVGRTAHDLERLAGADRDTGQRQPVGTRMALDREQLPDDDVAPVIAPADEPFDLHAEQGQPFRDLLGRQVDVDEFAQPGQRCLHRNCSRNVIKAPCRRRAA